MKDIARECKVSVADRFDCTFGQCEERPDFREQTGGDPADRQAVELFSKQQCIQSGQRQEPDNRCCHQ